MRLCVLLTKILCGLTTKSENVYTKKNDFNNKLETILKKLQCLQKQVINAIKTAKEQILKRILKELMNLSTIPKTYWSILSFSNDKKKDL